MQKQLDFQHYTTKANRTRNKVLARISYLRAIKDNLLKEEIHHDFARFLRDVKYYRAAEFRYKKASIIMKDAAVYNGWGLCLDRQGKIEGQEELYRKALEIEPNCRYGLCNLGAVLSETCKFEEAIVVLERLLVLRPNEAMALNNLGTIYLTLGKYDKTVEKLQKALEIDVSHLHAYINLGLANSCLGKDDEAKESYKRAIDLLGSNSDKKERIVRSLKLTKENVLKEEESDQEKIKHQEIFRKVLEELISILEGENVDLEDEK